MASTSASSKDKKYLDADYTIPSDSSLPYELHSSGDLLATSSAIKSRLPLRYDLAVASSASLTCRLS
jgi:hypothetical protein